ncbi:argininosuccinate lyase [Enterococcus lemanii]|uniref:Argininosuccinate lyase n=1 Tax=Enterococcus lemanii TaxID=1159752 RepID=A0ABV9MV45_9ENTE|nr:argininosuccinate lyase [Enterococcus lemanii]MBM7708619.1 argininosuccinate lyase [Enterococcus lemanii]
MVAQLWKGRFQKELDEKVNDFNSSIRFDARMYRQDIQGSIAHATMLGEQQIIEPSESQTIVAGLKEILADLENGQLEIDETAEDIHMFIETELTKRLGQTGKRLHTARSRNDQVALDLRFYLKEEVETLIALMQELSTTFCQVAKENTETVMSGYTHLQRAQPITFAHHLMAYVQMFLRDIERLRETQKRLDVMPLGSGALAGTTYPINRGRVAEILGFAQVTQNSLDGVSDRDFCLELNSDLAILMMHLSRFCEEVILWCSWEFKFVELDDAYATGSSMMPQKKNPDITELIRGKTGRVVGNLVTLLTMMKGLPLAYNKDMQEDKEAIFDTVDTVKLCVSTLTPMVATMKVLKENMYQAAAKGFINATDCADYLVKKGLPFREAYQVTGEIVAFCIEQEQTLETLPLADYQKFHPTFAQDIYQAIDLVECVNQRQVIGGPAKIQVEVQIKEALEKL